MGIQMNKEIYATYSGQTIIVYQAFNNEIADEAVKLGKFSSKFKVDRMTWIKTSFLWMMYRAGWATKEGQERVLAIEMKMEGFREILNNAVLSTYDDKVYRTVEEWKLLLDASEVRCQWDPDKDIYGNNLDSRAIQLGLKGSFVLNYINDWIVDIKDITEYVKDTKRLLDNKEMEQIILPITKKVVLTDNERFKLGVDCD